MERGFSPRKNIRDLFLIFYPFQHGNCGQHERAHRKHSLMRHLLANVVWSFLLLHQPCSNKQVEQHYQYQDTYLSLLFYTTSVHPSEPLSSKIFTKIYSFLGKILSHYVSSTKNFQHKVTIQLAPLHMKIMIHSK